MASNLRTPHNTPNPPEAVITASPDGRPQRYVHEFHVRFADLDPLNHVNNVRALTYLEDARVAFLRWNRAERDGQRFGGLVIARHEVDYLRPIALRRAPYRVETWVAEIGAVRFVLDYEIRDDDHFYLRASSVVVGYDVAAQRPRRLTADERSYLAAYLATARAAPPDGVKR